MVFNLNAHSFKLEKNNFLYFICIDFGIKNDLECPASVSGTATFIGNSTSY